MLWDELADAYDALRASERHGSAEEIGTARERVERAKDGLGALGSLLLLFALERGGLAVQRTLRGVFAADESAALEKSIKAGKRATWAIAHLDALQQRIRDLEEQVARLTPTLNEPPRLRIVG